jgi:hypothetical protein
MRLQMVGIFAIATLAVTACNGTTVTNAPQCRPPKGVQTVLVYPAPNSTAIPDTLPLVVLGSTSALPSGYQALVVNISTQNGYYYNTVGLPPNPIPTPNATPPFANPVYQTSGNPGVTWVSGSTLAVYLNDSNSGCNPTYQLGSFVVQ